MTHRSRVGNLACAVLFAVLCLAGPAWACDIPVHLWALQHWAPDPYPVLLFHEGTLSPAHQAALDRLQAGAGRANLVVRDVDVAAPLDEEARAVWQAQADPPLPWMVVRHPVPMPPAVKIWAGPLDDAAVDSVLDSPKRREIAQYLVDADAVVWVLLDGDDASAKALGDVLEQVRKNPPAPTPTPGATGADRTFPLPKFPVVRMSRTDPPEQVFAQMLLGIEPDLKGYAEPMAFPVFGRGRALYALVGAGINPQTVRNACTFLVSGCSCQVKEQNPGMDLLLAVDWNGRLGDVLPAGETELPPLPGVPRQETLATAAAPVPASPAILRNVLATLALGVVAVAGASVALWRQRGARFHG